MEREQRREKAENVLRMRGDEWHINEVKIAGSVRIDEHAFSRADICHLIFDKNIRAQISETAFADTKIKELDIPEHLYKQYKLIWDKIE